MGYYLSPWCLGTNQAPLGRQDFVIDKYQVDEALAHGADTVLLMVPWPLSARTMDGDLSICFNMYIYTVTVIYIYYNWNIHIYIYIYYVKLIID